MAVVCTVAQVPCWDPDCCAALNLQSTCRTAALTLNSVASGLGTCQGKALHLQHRAHATCRTATP